MRTQPASPPVGTMTLLDHLRELRSRLMKASVAVVLGLVAGFIIVYNTSLIPYMIERFVGPGGVQITEVTESFTSTIKVSLTVALIAAMPVIIYQLLAFLAPGLTSRERRWVFLGLPLVIAFFLGGLAFGWFITAPAAITFLIELGPSVSDLIENKPKLDDFLGILTWLLLMNGLIFELPMIIYILVKLHVLNPRKVARYRRYVILGVVVLSAIITPTGDPANLALVAVPMYLLFEFGLILGRFA